MTGKWILIRFWAGMCVMMDFGLGFAALFSQPAPRVFWGATVGAHVWLAVLVWTAAKKKKE